MVAWWQERWIWPWIALGLGIIAIVFLWTWLTESEDARAIQALPEPQRQGLYQRTMETLRTVCEPAPPRAMRDFCRAQAELVRHFPECDSECAEIAHRHLTMPTR